MAFPTVKAKKQLPLCFLGALGLLLFGGLSLFVGKYPLSLNALLQGDPMHWRVFLTLRLSRTAVGVIGGFALGLSGFVYQTVLRNPLASPDIIGVSSGASAGAAAGILFCSGAVSVTLSAFLGASPPWPCACSWRGWTEADGAAPSSWAALRSIPSPRPFSCA